jgi:hypothetical protein
MPKMNVESASLESARAELKRRDIRVHPYGPARIAQLAGLIALALITLALAAFLVFEVFNQHNEHRWIALVFICALSAGALGLLAKLGLDVRRPEHTLESAEAAAALVQLPIRLRRTRLGQIKTIALGVGFVAGSLGMLESHPLGGGLGLVFFGSLTLALIADTIWPWSYLDISQEGIRIPSLSRPFAIGWSQIKGFSVLNFVGKEYVCFDCTDGVDRYSFWRKTNNAIVGADFMLSDFGVPARDLAPLLEVLRRRYSPA